MLDMYIGHDRVQTLFSTSKMMQHVDQMSVIAWIQQCWMMLHHVNKLDPFGLQGLIPKL